jgi:hypothetical protein
VGTVLLSPFLFASAYGPSGSHIIYARRLLVDCGLNAHCSVYRRPTFDASEPIWLTLIVAHVRF